MSKLRFGGGGRYPQAQMPATEVILAGRKALLPNYKVPYVVQKLTMAQIRAIPTDMFSVQVLGMPDSPSSSLKLPSLGKRRVAGTTMRDKQQMKRMVRKIAGGGRASRIGRDIGAATGVNDSGDTAESLYDAIVTLHASMGKKVEELYLENRRISRVSSDEETQKERLFHAPIDEGLMSDLIIRAKVYFFDSKDKFKLYGHVFKVPEFFLFVHYYFIRVKILKNTARKPFSEYVRKVVLRDENSFTDKTFNNYAKSYEDREQDFTNPDIIKINFNILPDTNKNKTQQLINAFQEIGHFFHKSDYFSNLREIRDQMNKFDI